MLTRSFHLYAMCAILLLAPMSCAMSLGMEGDKRQSISGEQIDEFLDALLSRNERKLSEYLGAGRETLDKEELDFLYGEDPDGEWKSVLEISKMGKIEHKIVPQSGGVVTVLFSPDVHFQKLDDIDFLTSEWMKKYFACEFERFEKRWIFHMNVCFAETDGPFPGY